MGTVAQCGLLSFQFDKGGGARREHRSKIAETKLLIWLDVLAGQPALLARHQKASRIVKALPHKSLAENLVTLSIGNALKLRSHGIMW
jgi:hypothetical protein